MDIDYHTPLYLAMSGFQTRADADVIEMLLQSGARIDSNASDDQLPVYFAVLLDKPRILRTLFKHGIHTSVAATSPTTQQTSPMHCAANYGHTECLKILADNGFDPNLQMGFQMMTPLHVAIRSAGVAHIFSDAVARCMKTLRAMLEVNVNFEASCYGRDACGYVQCEATTPFEYALFFFFDRFDVAHFLADVVNVDIQSIRRRFRKRRRLKWNKSPLEDEMVLVSRPGESEAKQMELLSLLRKASNPWSLRSLSRSVIRKQLGRRIKDINTIYFPTSLKHYVTFNYDYAS